MTKRPLKAAVQGKPWVWIAVAVGIALALALSLRGSRVAENVDRWEGDAPDAGAVEAPPSSVEVPLRIYNSHLAHLRFAPDGHAVLAFGTEGATLRSTDDGQSWQDVDVPTRQSLVASVVDAHSGSIVVVGNRGTVLRSDGAGQTFAPVPVDTERSFHAVALSADGGRILAVGDEGIAYSSRDGGRSFASEVSGTPNYLSRVVALPKRARFVVAGDKGTLLLRDDGVGWRAIPTPAAGLFMALDVLPSGKLLAATQNGFILSSDDDGETWQEAYKAAPDSFVMGFEANDVGSILAARMRRGELLLSTDQGKSFERLQFEATQAIARLVWMEGRGFIGVGAGGGVLSSDETGKRWSLEPGMARERPLSMAIHPATKTVLVVGGSGLIARSTDGGQQYHMVRPGLGGVVRAFADNSGAGCLVAVGLDATIVHSLDSGKSWQRVPLGIDPKVELTSVVVEPKTRALIASGTGGTLLRSADCGRTWAALRATGSDVSFLLVSESSRVLAFGTKSRVLSSTDAGMTFVPAEMDAEAALKRAVAVSATEIVAVGDAGRIYRSTDDGKSFGRVMSGTDANLRALSYDRVHHALWAAGDGGTVLRSIDGGVTWKRVMVATQENLFVIGLHPQGDVVWLGGNAGTVLRSSDQGQHFTRVTSGSTQTIRVIAFDLISNEFVVAGAGGTLLRSVAGGGLSKVAATLNGRIDAALFHPPSRALFLGGDRLVRIGG